LNELYPGIEIVGTYSPPFRALSDEEFADQDRMITESGAEIVWVGLGTPKQDVECKRMAASIPVTAVAVGAAFDFTAGTLETAPAWMRKAGIEWLHRLSSEPKRLWKRYLFGNTRFLYSAIRHGNGRA
jgi:N-acetylglucosaminyldiphosphoundecaprenol N-acetyl-beta-D-mannosaminyltransferase